MTTPQSPFNPRAAALTLLGLALVCALLPPSDAAGPLPIVLMLVLLALGRQRRRRRQRQLLTRPGTYSPRAAARHSLSRSSHNYGDWPLLLGLALAPPLLAVGVDSLRVRSLLPPGLPLSLATLALLPLLYGLFAVPLPRRQRWGYDAATDRFHREERVGFGRPQRVDWPAAAFGALYWEPLAGWLPNNGARIGLVGKDSGPDVLLVELNSSLRDNLALAQSWAEQLSEASGLPLLRPGPAPDEAAP